MPAHKPEDLHTLFVKAFNDGDIDALLALYEDGARLLVNGTELVGKTAIREGLNGFLSMKLPIELETRFAFRTGDGIGLMSGAWKIEGTMPGGSAINMSGITAETVRRQADGSWLYILDVPSVQA